MGSMVPSSAVALWNYYDLKSRGDNVSVPVLIVYIGILLHNPIAFAYHIYCALKHPEHPVDVVLCRMDITGILLCCVAFAFAISGSIWYTSPSVVNAALGIRWVWTWTPELKVAPGFFKYAIIGTMWYAFAFVYRGDLKAFLECLAAGTMMALSFLFSQSGALKGWGHTLFHIFAACLAMSVFAGLRRREGTADQAHF